MKFKGLINVSGFHVDPGFDGRLKFSVYNAGNRPIHLAYGQPYFLLWFAFFDSAVRDPYRGTHNGQNGITAEDRDQMSEGSHSPAALHQRLAKVEHHLNLFIGITSVFMAAIILPMIAGIAIVLAQRWLETGYTQAATNVVSRLPGGTNAASRP